MAGIFSLLMGIFALLMVVAFIVIASILIGLFFTGFIGGIILLFTGKKLSQSTQKKVGSRICLVIGAILLCVAGGSAGVIISFITQFMG